MEQIPNTFSHQECVRMLQFPTLETIPPSKKNSTPRALDECRAKQQEHSLAGGHLNGENFVSLLHGESYNFAAILLSTRKQLKSQTVREAMKCPSGLEMAWLIRG